MPKDKGPVVGYTVTDDGDMEPRYAGDTDQGDTEATVYDNLTAAQLKAEIAQRNEGRSEDDQIPATGNKATLVAALVTDDETTGQE